MPTKTDPRLAELVGEPTANEKAMAWSIRRAMRNLQLANGESRKVLGFLNREVLPDLEAKLRARLEAEERRGFGFTDTTRRMGELARVIDSVLQPAAAAIVAEQRRSLSAIAQAEAQAAIDRLNAITPTGLGIDFTAPAPETLRAIVTEQTFNGDLLENWYGEETARTRKAALREINVGIAQGEPVDAIMRRIRGTAAADYEDGVLATTRREAETLVRTSVRHTTESARQLSYRDNERLVDGYEWVATLDTRTCLICAPLDGTVYRFDGDGEKRKPPAHPNCRCTTTPVLKTFRQLGIDADEIPPGERASDAGPVPATQTYGEWLKGQPANVQAEVLGVRKAAEFRAGRLEIGDFVDRKDRVLTLADLDLLEKT